MGVKEDRLFAKLTRSLKARMSLILLIVLALVLAGGGLMVYFYTLKEASHPLAGPVFIGLLAVELLAVGGLMIGSARNMRRLGEVTAVKERMEKELEIARGIQMSMIPKTFPPYPERSDVDIYASIVPAKEVGGDLYDFFIRDERLYFCIGDVSGKGVPASLVMAVTRSLFRTVSAHEKSPERIVAAMNGSMAEMNESSMFVTFFCGVLDLETGHLCYCNAGHNAPVLLGKTQGAPLPVVPNVPLGIVPDASFQEQETDLGREDALFLYTDGVTEAENTAHELFGDARLEQVLQDTTGSAREQIERVKRAVTAFAGEAPQSDDLTILLIRMTHKR